MGQPIHEISYFSHPKLKFLLENRHRDPFLVVARIELVWTDPFSASQPFSGASCAPKLLFIENQ